MMRKTKQEERKQGLPQVAVDYCTLGEDEQDKDDAQPCIVARDKWTGMIWALLVTKKGCGDDQVVKQLTKFIDSLGYTTMELKSDGEPALVEVMKHVKDFRKQPHTIEASTGA